MLPVTPSYPVPCLDSDCTPAWVLTQPGEQDELTQLKNNFTKSRRVTLAAQLLGPYMGHEGTTWCGLEMIRRKKGQ